MAPIHFQMRLAFVRSACLFLPLLLLLTGCAAAGNARNPAPSTPSAGLSGHLLIVGGGLDDDSRLIYERFVELATHAGRSPTIIIATAASGDQEVNAVGKIEALRAYSRGARIEVIRRETPAADAVALIDAATGMLFTGGDQKRITAKYRPDGVDGPEALAMRRLLERGGVIAGCSAGDAMMSDPMFLTGRSADALGIPTTRADAIMGPQIGAGMGFLPWAMTESHFFERHRFGRLVAGLEAAGRRIGIGVGEDAAVEVDLATGELFGVGVSDSLLVDIGSMRRDGITRSSIRARVIRRGMGVRIAGDHALPGEPPPKPQTRVQIPVVEEGQNRQLASWRFFLAAERICDATQVITLDGYEQKAWPDGRGWSVVDITPLPTK